VVNKLNILTLATSRILSGLLANGCFFLVVNQVG